MNCPQCGEVEHQAIPEDRSHCDRTNYCPCRYTNEDVVRFWSKVSCCSGECWEWLGTRNKAGYGVITMPGNVQRIAHRLAYSLWGGVVVEGLTIDHLCRNRGCCNPAHLEQVTNAENVRRGDNWQRAKTHCPKGHEYTLENTIQGKNGQGRKCRACALIADRKRYNYQGGAK